MNNKPYGALSSFYDKLMSDYPYEKITDKLKSYLSGKGFDLGAGSGRITVELKKAGLDVIGVDDSEEMLEMANLRARQEKVAVKFVKGSAVDFELTPCDFVISTCDVFNYLPSFGALEKTLKNIYSSLRKKGKLVFDLRRGDILKAMKDEVYFEDLDDITYLWSNSQRGNKLVMDIAFFTKQEDNLYQRRDERHEFLILSDEKIIETLEKVGFKVKTYGDGLGKRKPQDKRIFLFCEK